MRTIKFRAWDKERNEMRQVQLMDFSSWWVSTGSTWERGNSLEYGERNSFKNEETDRHIIMQYTGLNDKNGKEIYEGDIYHLGDKRILSVVEWHDSGFMGKQIGTYGSREGLQHWRDQIEIIGNIYESPAEVTP